MNSCRDFPARISGNTACVPRGYPLARVNQEGWKMHSTELKSPVRSIRSALQILLLTVASLFVCVSAFSQGSARRLLGAITDQTGGVVSGATATIIATQRNVTRR